MVEVDFSGNYTNELNCKTGDKGTVLEEGTYEKKKNMQDEEYMALNLPVEINGKKLLHSPRMKEGQELVKAWGHNTNDWVGKEFEVEVVSYTSFGVKKKAVELIPLE